MKLLAIGLLLTAQGPSAPPQDGEGWVLLDGVAAQAGDGIVTLRDLDTYVTTEVDRLVEEGKISSREEFAAASTQLSMKGLRELVIEELEAQGGQDMGLDATEIDRMISLQIEDERKRIGATNYVDKLAEDGTDPLADLNARTKSLYRLLWARSKLGMPGPGGSRPLRDRFIRPGELRLIYRSNREGLVPPRVRLQSIVMPIAAAGSLAEARKILKDALGRAYAGEDFGDLVDQFSSEGRNTRGITEWISVPQFGDTPLGRWAARAPVDEFSPIFEMPPNGQPEVLILSRIHERDDPPPPDFEGDRIQRNLRQVFSNIRDSRIMEFEQGRLGQQSYMWLNPNLRGTRELSDPNGLVSGAGAPQG